MTRRFRLWMPALALVALAACDSPTEPRLGVPAVTLEAVGDAAQLTAHGAEGELPAWESLDETVVAVTPAGMAVAVPPGTATVRARLGSRQAEGSVTVLPAVEVKLSNLRVVSDPGATIPDFAVVYSREPRSLGYQRTGCVRLDGVPGCPIH